MRYEDWEPLYREILGDFGFDGRGDVESARRLDSLLPESRPSADARLGALAGASVTVAGPAMKGAERLRAPGPVIVADSAVSLLPDGAEPPLAIVTDLDGDIGAISRHSARGSVVVVHAHGDNAGRLDAVRGFTGPTIGTCQCEPFGRLRNFGGFTDGDRAAFLAEEFGASSIELVGFDFGNPAPKDGADPGVKLRKLAWAKRLLGLVKIPVTIGGRPLV
jgi:uncharacterized Rossmann fold enzyme